MTTTNLGTSEITLGLFNYLLRWSLMPHGFSSAIRVRLPARLIITFKFGGDKDEIQLHV